MSQSTNQLKLKSGMHGKLYKIYVFSKKIGDDIGLLLQLFESLVLKDELAVRKQSGIFNFFEKK